MTSSTSSSSPPPIDIYLSALACACTVVATLRAGSRLCYMAAHGGRIGLIDGPRILGPSDVMDVTSVISSHDGEGGVVDVDDVSGLREIGDDGEASSESLRGEEVSPLWEVAYGFERAVAFSLDDDDLGDDDGPAFHSGGRLGSSPYSSQASESSRQAGKGEAGGGGSDGAAGGLITTEVQVPYLMSPFGVVVRNDRLNAGDVAAAAEGDDRDEDRSSEESDTELEDEEDVEVVEGGGDVVADDISTSTTTVPPGSDDDDGEVMATTRGRLAVALSYPRRFGRAMWNSVPSTSSVRSTANFLVIRPLRRLERGATSTAWRAYSSLASSWRRGQGRLWWPSSPSLDKTLRSDFAGSKSKTIVLPQPSSPVPVAPSTDGEDDAGAGWEGRHLRTRRRRTGRVARITAYAPRTFRELRTRCFGVDDDEFARAMDGPFVSFQSNSKGAARAGGYFFFSRDGAYMIKYIKRTEARTFLRMLPKYHRHMRRNSRRSLLTRICGMYEVRLLDAVVEEVDVDDEDGKGAGGHPPR